MKFDGADLESAPALQNDSGPAQDVPWHAITTIAFLLIGVAFSPLLLALLVVALLTLLLFPAAVPLFFVFIVGTIGVGHTFSIYPIDLVAFKLYGVDLVMLLLAYATVHFLIRPRAWWAHATQPEKIVFALLGAFCVYGFAQLPYGLVIKGYDYDQVFGDFRRLFFYNLALIPPLWLPLKTRHLDRLKYAFAMAALLLIATGLYRVLLNQPIRLDENLATGHTGVRMLATIEFSAGALFLAYLTSVSIIQRRLSVRVVAVVLAGCMAALMAISGFRLGILYAAAAPVMALFIITYLRRRSYFILFRYLFLGGLVGILVATIAAMTFPAALEKARYDLEVRQMDLVVTGDYRTWTTRQAVIEWREDPIFGAGLGHELVFLNRTRQGFFEHKQASAHNLVTAVVYQTGLLGLVLFLSFHACFCVAVLLKVRLVPRRYDGVIAGLLVGYVCMLGASLTQPLDVAGCAAIGLFMGLVLRLLREGEIKPQTPPIDIPVET